MRIRLLQIVALSIISIFLQSCDSEYERMLKRELSSGKIVNDLFFGLELGMSSKEFYGKCWELNNDSLLYHGAMNTTVEHRFELNGKATRMNFYPEFHEGKVYEMPVTFTYTAFAPWNASYSVDTLLQETLGYISQWFGDEFIRMEHPEKGIAYVNVTGNRRIIVYPGEKHVNMLISDLSFEEQVLSENISKR